MSVPAGDTRKMADSGNAGGEALYWTFRRVGLGGIKVRRCERLWCVLCVAAGDCDRGRGQRRVAGHSGSGVQAALQVHGGGGRSVHPPSASRRSRICGSGSCDLARKNLGQPYDIYLLGEMPFETYDPQPIYCLSKSDCVVFARAHLRDGAHRRLAGVHEDAAADSLPRRPDRRRHAEPLHRGRLGEVEPVVGARHHAEVASGQNSENCGVAFDERIDRAKFLKGRYGLTVDIPVEMHHDLYLPYTEVDRAARSSRTAIS